MHRNLARRIACTAFLATFTPAQTPDGERPKVEPPAAAGPAKPAIRMDATTIILPPGTFTAREVVDAAAKFLGHNILLDERELQGGASNQVTLQSPMRLDRAGFEEVFCDLLDASQMVLVTRDEPKGLYEVLSKIGPRALEAFHSPPNRTVEEILRRPTLKRPVSTVLRLQTINAIVATNALRPLFGGAGGPSLMSLYFGEGTDGLVLVGLQADVAKAIDIVRRQDGDQPETEVPGAEDRLAKLEQQIAALHRDLAELKAKLPARTGDKR